MNEAVVILLARRDDRADLGHPPYGMIDKASA